MELETGGPPTGYREVMSPGAESRELRVEGCLLVTERVPGSLMGGRGRGPYWGCRGRLVAWFWWRCRGLTGEWGVCGP